MSIPDPEMQIILRGGMQEPRPIEVALRMVDIVRVAGQVRMETTLGLVETPVAETTALLQVAVVAVEVRPQGLQVHPEVEAPVQWEGREVHLVVDPQDQDLHQEDRVVEEEIKFVDEGKNLHTSCLFTVHFSRF